jgi:hypothetical protein
MAEEILKTEVSDCDEAKFFRFDIYSLCVKIYSVPRYHMKCMKNSFMFNVKDA